MASVTKKLLSVEEFLALEFAGDEGRRVELDNGVIRMMAGGNLAHSRIQRNLIAALFDALKGSGCGPYGSDLGVQTHDLSLRYPDVSVFCGRDLPENDKLRAFDDPRLVAEILSPSTRQLDLEVKLREYCAVRSLRAIVYIDPDLEAVRLLTRSTGQGWTDVDLPHGHDVALDDLRVTLKWADIFARG